MLAIHFLSWSIELNWLNQKCKNLHITSLNPLFSNSLSPKTYFKYFSFHFMNMEYLPTVLKIINIKRYTEEILSPLYLAPSLSSFHSGESSHHFDQFHRLLYEHTYRNRYHFLFYLPWQKSLPFERGKNGYHIAVRCL